MTQSLVELSLEKASKSYAQCAKAAKAKAGPNSLSASEYEMLIGIGIAHDWIGWARDLKHINYSKPKRASFDRAYAIHELTRFTFMWTAMNALFSRETLLRLFSSGASVGGSELERFRILFQHANISSIDRGVLERKLHSILALPMEVKQFPWLSVNTPPTILEVIYFKYTVANEQRRGIGKKLLQAATSGNYSALDLPTLIYATRNWNIHGVLLSSAFRGIRKKFNVWIDLINLALARTLEGVATEMRKVI